VIAVLPPPADKLVEQARAVMESGDLDKMMDARDKGPLSLYARHYPDDPDQARKKQMSDWKDDVDASLRQDQLQKKIARARRQDQAFKPENDSERLAQQALAFEEFGDVVSAGQRWIELNSRNEKDPEDFKLVLLAHKKWRELKDRMTPDPAAARLEFLRKRLDEVKELRESDKPTRAEQLWKEITTLYKDLDDPAVQQLIKDATPQGG
jgi:preprotein translocase subunit SecD